MIDFFVKVPKDKVKFISTLFENLGLEYQQLMHSSNETEHHAENGEEFFVDSDD